jgi:hypothetical protein
VYARARLTEGKSQVPKTSAEKRGVKTERDMTIESRHDLCTMLTFSQRLVLCTSGSLSARLVLYCPTQHNHQLLRVPSFVLARVDSIANLSIVAIRSAIMWCTMVLAFSLRSSNITHNPNSEPISSHTTKRFLAHRISLSVMYTLSFHNGHIQPFTTDNHETDINLPSMLLISCTRRRNLDGNI